MTLSQSDSLTLVARVLERARLDMEAGDPEALTWLASSQATSWLDAFDIPQSYYLYQIDWLEYCERILTGPPVPISPSAYRTILTTYNYLIELRPDPCPTNPTTA